MKIRRVFAVTLSRIGYQEDPHKDTESYISIHLSGSNGLETISIHSITISFFQVQNSHCLGRFAMFMRICMGMNQANEKGYS